MYLVDECISVFCIFLMEAMSIYHKKSMSGSKGFDYQELYTCIFVYH